MPLCPVHPSAPPPLAFAPSPGRARPITRPAPLFHLPWPRPYLGPRKKGYGGPSPLLHPSDSAPYIQRRVNGPLPSCLRPPPAGDAPTPFPRTTWNARPAVRPLLHTASPRQIAHGQHLIAGPYLAVHGPGPRSTQGKSGHGARVFMNKQETSPALYPANISSPPSLSKPNCSWDLAPPTPPTPMPPLPPPRTRIPPPPPLTSSETFTRTKSLNVGAHRPALKGRLRKSSFFAESTHRDPAINRASTKNVASSEREEKKNTRRQNHTHTDKDL